MIEFTCPGCTSTCVANGVFRGMRARCLVCGAFIRIPAESGEVAFPLGLLPTGPLPNKPAKARAKRPKPLPAPQPENEPGAHPDSERPGDSDIDLSDTTKTEAADGFKLQEDDPGAKPATKEKDGEEKKKKSKKKAVTGSGAELDGGSDWNDFDAEPAPEPQPEPAPAKRGPKARRKRQYYIIGGSVAASVVIALVLAFSGDKKPKLPDTPPVDTAARETPPPPPPPKKEVKKEEKKDPPVVVVQEAPPPRALSAPERRVAAQLIAERTVNPTAFDAANRGKLYLVRGTFGRLVKNVLFLTEGDEDQGGIACVLPVFGKRTEPFEPTPELLALKPGQAVIVRGWYSADLRFTFCDVVATAGPADDEYREKDIELVGVVGRSSGADAEGERFPTVVLEPATTDCPISVRCLFRLTEGEKISKLRPGQTVTIRGRCAGRAYRVVRLHDCALLADDEPPTVDIRVPADRFFAAYEVDLLPFERPRPDAPYLAVTAGQLATAYMNDPVAANARYQHKGVSVSGKVLERRPASRTVVLETGTSHKYQVSAVFTSVRYAALKDYPEITIRGVCSGSAGAFVRLENAEYFDPDAGNPAVRTTPEFLPLQQGSELVYDLLTPIGSKDYPLSRYSLRVGTGNQVQMTPLRAGTFSKPSLFSDPPGQAKWTKDLTKQKNVTQQVSEFRLNEGAIETRERPAGAPPGAWWDPVFKLGLRKGDTWLTTMPDGRTVTYTVAAFKKDELRRHTVEIQRVMKNPKDPATWDEATITYTRGIGEVRRVLTKQTSGRAVTVLETKLVDAESTVPELKKETDLTTPGKKDEKK